MGIFLSALFTQPIYAKAALNGSTRKAQNRKLIQARKEADQNVVTLQSRIQLLDSEDSRMLKKIDQTRRLADKIANA